MRCPICKTSLKDEEMYVCDKCKKLPQQLAEKDKEIEQLTTVNNYLFKTNEKLLEEIEQGEQQ